MDYINSIMQQYRESGFNTAFLEPLQEIYRVNGDTVIELPNELEPFIIQKCPELFYKIIDITERAGLIERDFDRLPETIKPLIVNTMITEELVATNQIDGVRIDPRPIDDVLNDRHIQNRAYTEKKTVLIYQQTLNRNFQVDSTLTIRRLYDQLITPFVKHPNTDHLGQKFRKDSYTMFDHTNKPIHNGLDGEKNIDEAITAILDYLNNDPENIYIKLAVFHYLFGYVHPVYSGNGRLARLINSFYLSPKMNIASLAVSSCMAAESEKYFQMFNDTNSHHNVKDLTSFVFGYLDFISQALDQTSEMLAKLATSDEQFTAKLESLSISKSAKKLLLTVYLADTIDHKFNVSTLAKLLEISLPTIRTQINNFVEDGLLHKDKIGRQFVVSLNKENQLFSDEN